MRVDSWALASGEVSWDELREQYKKSKELSVDSELDYGSRKTAGCSDKKLRKARSALVSGPKKGKCCNARPRCVNCPTVVHRLRKQQALELDNEALRAALINARRW